MKENRHQMLPSFTVDETTHTNKVYVIKQYIQN